MTNVAVLSIGVTGTLHAARDRVLPKTLPDLPFEERARAVFREVPAACFMSPSPEDRFQVGLAVLLMEDVTPDSGERARLDKSVDGLKALSAAMSGVPVDLSRAFNGDDGVEPYPVIMWFREECP